MTHSQIKYTLPQPTRGKKKNQLLKNLVCPLSLTPAPRCPSVFPVLVLEQLCNYFSFLLWLVFIIEGSPPSDFHSSLFNKILSSVYPVARNLPKSLVASRHSRTQQTHLHLQTKSSGSIRWASLQPPPQVPWAAAAWAPCCFWEPEPGEGKGLESMK